MANPVLNMLKIGQLQTDVATNQTGISTNAAAIAALQSQKDRFCIVAESDVDLNTATLGDGIFSYGSGAPSNADFGIFIPFGCTLKKWSFIGSNSVVNQNKQATFTLTVKNTSGVVVQTQDLVCALPLTSNVSQNLAITASPFQYYLSFKQIDSGNFAGTERLRFLLWFEED